MDIRYKVIPAAKRLDVIDEQDLALERKLKAGECDLTEYAQTKHALILKRRKEWATVCRAMGWPIEYNPLTHDPESIVSNASSIKPLRDWDYVGPAIAPDELTSVDEQTEDVPPEVKRRRRLHYLIFWGWVVILSGLYLWLGS